MCPIFIQESLPLLSECVFKFNFNMKSHFHTPPTFLGLITNAMQAYIHVLADHD